ncbi:MAG: WecB/TagA/CpsF family glycosyltransferase [Proteobacteria bacterium]|nr:WecB/TagA/CpsF family glycosyltransferase [Pseudomonadota bacterium]MBU1738860.1 WecB/TagA/CpsF family glycosyltransferase [Pseudomonadota bacterium]
MDKTLRILDINIHNLSYVEVLEKVEEFIRSGQSHIMVCANPEMVLYARRKPEYRDFINRADLVTPDGVGLLLAARVLGHPLKERVTGTDLSESFGRLSAEKGYSMYFLGGEPGIAEEAASSLANRYPGVNIVGIHHGFFSSDDEKEIVADIKNKKPDILMVCLGMYIQEMWIQKYFRELNVPVCLGNGGALDFVAGKRRRAPKWLMGLGLEWLFRLIQDPSWARIKRQMTLPLFVFKVLLQKAGFR